MKISFNGISQEVAAGTTIAEFLVQQGVQPAAVVAERQRAMTGLKHELSAEYRLKQLGKPLEVLFETKEDGLWCGHSPNYVKVYAMDGERNTLATVTPTALFGDGVRV